jgi:DNA-binding beta-propeller fold protein YncE
MKNKFIFYLLAFLLISFLSINCNKKSDEPSKLTLLSGLQKLNDGGFLPSYLNTPSPSATTITLTIAVENASIIQLMWTALPTAVSYKVYRDVTFGFIPSAANELVSTATTATLKSPRGNLVTPLNSTVTSAKNFSGLTAATRYYYRIAGVSSSGTETLSNEANAVAGNVFTVRTHAGSGVAGSAAAGTGVIGNINGDGFDAKFTFPQGLSVDSNGYIYLADAGDQLIRRISPRIGDVVNAGGAAYAIEGQATTFAGTGFWGNVNSSVPSTASFFDPWSTCVDSTTGNIYVADSTNHSIRQITTAGVVSTLAGFNKAASGSGSADGIGTAASFNYPQSITCDGTNIFVADTYNNLIRKIVIATATVNTIAGTAGQSGQGSTDATGTAARFYLPKGIVVDNTGTNLYVADSGNHTIRKIVIATGAVTTLAGTVGVQGKLDGASATFSFPRGIAYSTVTGYVYVADSGNHLIRQITSTGVVATVAGTGFQGSQDGIGIYASFWHPQGIVFSSVGSGCSPGCLYVSDTENHKIRRITGTSL